MGFLIDCGILKVVLFCIARLINDLGDKQERKVYSLSAICLCIKLERGCRLVLMPNLGCQLDIPEKMEPQIRIFS